MTASSLDSVRMREWLLRIQNGDATAQEELLQAACGRLERLARKMLHQFPKVRSLAETGDVLQNSLLRLLRALQEVRPASTRDFFNLAAVQMRRELLDLGRHFYGPRGEGANRAPLIPAPQAGDPQAAIPDPRTAVSEDLERWSTFHEAVERLPAPEREVVGLKFYHGWTEAQIGELFGVTERTVRRRWSAACLKLYEALHDGLPHLSD